jgi:hypothetical protein
VIPVVIKWTQKEPPIPVTSNLQPDKCRGCVWGNWTGSKQMCILPQCAKTEKSEMVIMIKN